MFECDIPLNRNRLLLFFTIGSSSNAADPLLGQVTDKTRRRASCPPTPLAPTGRTTPRLHPNHFCSTRLEADRRELRKARTRSPFELSHHVAKETTVRLKRCGSIESEVAEPVV
jgi:hypothetical protein